MAMAVSISITFMNKLLFSSCYVLDPYQNCELLANRTTELCIVLWLQVEMRVIAEATA